MNVVELLQHFFCIYLFCIYLYKNIFTTCIIQCSIYIIQKQFQVFSQCQLEYQFIEKIKSIQEKYV
jgi:hypothetical protein